MQEDARKHALPISVGVHEPSDDPASKRIKNTLLWIDHQGKIAQRYQKLYLFDLEIEGGPVMKESNVIEPGKSILPPFESPVGKIGDSGRRRAGDSGDVTCSAGRSGMESKEWSR